ncbi:MAG: cytochrome b N-terminal domain-containing protein, partial [Thermodesulfobacteriota bacterium]|nr:cytochrome b N-terminal domain-containing protein [Thermodesulfobacteriota bacterium]
MINDEKSLNQKKWLKAIPIDIQGLYEKVDEPLPHSARRWWWCWGGIVGLLFLLVSGTGLLLAMYYRAEPETAYNSVAYITEHARYGKFIRSVHQWSANFMIIFLFLHMLRVFVTGAYREYRWGAWIVGVCLLGITLGMGVTGYSLVYE